MEQVDLHSLKEEVLTVTRGRWRDILPALSSINPSLLNGKGGPCPMCPKGGTDRFSFTDYDGYGSVFCRQCNCEGTTSKDGIGALQWLNGWGFVEALKEVARYAGIAVDGPSAERPTEPILNRVAKLKGCDPAFMLRYGCWDDKRHDDGGTHDVIRFPLFGLVDKELKAVSTFDLGIATDRLRKGKAEFDKEPGVFLPHGVRPDGTQYNWRPSKDKAVFLVEGVKDAAKLLELGYTAIGLPSTRLPKHLWSLFADLIVYLVPDRDTAGESGAARNARLLWGIAREIRIVRLPSEIKPKEGDGVREIARQQDGPKKIADAVAMTRPWEPPQVELTQVMTFLEAASYWHAKRSSRQLKEWSTGVDDLDFSIGGFSESDYVILAGRPGRGKTAFALHLAVQHVLNGGTALICSEEMGVDDLAERILQRAMRKTRGQLRHAVAADGQTLLDEIHALTQYGRLLISPKQKNIDDILKTVQSAVVEHGVTMCFLDYVQIVDGKGRDDRERLAYSSNELAAASKKLGVAVVALSQLNRNADQNDRPPTMSDLKGSGALEQDPDFVLAVNWQGMDDTGDPHPFEIHCLKSRNTGIKRALVKCAFDPRYYLFDETKLTSVRDDYFGE